MSWALETTQLRSNDAEWTETMVHNEKQYARFTSHRLVHCCAPNWRLQRNNSEKRIYYQIPVKDIPLENSLPPVTLFRVQKARRTCVETSPPVEMASWLENAFGCVRRAATFPSMNRADCFPSANSCPWSKCERDESRNQARFPAPLPPCS